MKISLSWIADHIKIPRNELNAAYLAERLAAITAEVDAVDSIHTDLSVLYAVVVKDLTENEALVDCPELKKDQLAAAQRDFP